jgi:BMFP domain-containing protein YqiC
MNEEVKTAIVANDYASFVESAPEKLLERIHSEEAFDEFVAYREAKDQIQADAESQVLDAVQSNDFAAFQKVQTDTKAKMKELHDSLELVESKEGDSERVRPEPTAEQTAKMEEKQQERFEEIVSYYEEN